MAVPVLQTFDVAVVRRKSVLVKKIYTVTSFFGQCLYFIIFKLTDHCKKGEMTDLVITLHTNVVNIKSKGANVKYSDALRIKLFRFVGLIHEAPSLILKRRQGLVNCISLKELQNVFVCLYERSMIFSLICNHFG